ncbi:MAG: twin-arginine translocation signal protein, partial [Geminicoccaceae bacterium]|nr:twin-arginine translocation signal protein [Geminicoccaceae bacterium]
MARIHPYIPKLIEQLEERRVDRREFLRTSTLLGLSATTAYGIVGRVFGESAIPKARAQGKPGGTLRVAMEVQKMDDPATYSWVQMSNQTRHIAEYLAITGPDNVTRPMLAESWEASDDLKTWTFHLRQGVMWHNGEDFVADHVVWNVERWRNADLGSSNIGLSTFASMDSVEAVDPHTVRFNLNKPVLSAPEDCYNYPT